jgi:hypothetical protein
MAITVKNIIPRKFAEDTQTTQYTAVNCKTVIDKFTATNVSAASVIISVNLVSSGGVATPSNAVTYNKTIAVGEVYNFPELIGQVLEAGGFISLVVNTTLALTVSASGREIT